MAVIVNVLAMAQDEPPLWVGLLALLPLILLLITGLYLFVLPHATRWRQERSTGDWSERNGQKDA